MDPDIRESPLSPRITDANRAQATRRMREDAWVETCFLRLGNIFVPVDIAKNLPWRDDTGMEEVNEMRNHTDSQTSQLLPGLEESGEAVETAHPEPATSLEAIDLKGVANFATLRAELLLIEHKIFEGETPDGLAKLRNLLIPQLGRMAKAGLQTGLLLIAIKAALTAENNWVLYGSPIARAMGLKSVTGLNHIIRHAVHAAKLPKMILSAMIELGLEPIDGRNRRLVTNLIARNFSGTSKQATTLVQEEQDLVTEAKREARAKSATKKGKKGNGVAIDHPAQPLSEKLRNSPDGERLAVVEAEVAALNNEIVTCLPGYRLQLVPVEDAANDKVTNESHRASSGLEEYGPLVVVETRTEVARAEDVDIFEEDEDFPLYPRTAEEQKMVSLKPGDRSGLLELIKKLCGTGFEVVLGPLVPNEQAGVLDYVFRGVTQSCCPAVRRGFFIDSGANFTAPPLQARKGESLQRAS